MIMNIITANRTSMQLLHTWTILQNNSIYRAISEAVPGLI